MEFWTSLASLLGVLAFCQSLLQMVFPPELRFASLKFLNRPFNCFSSYCYYDITEIDGVNTNELYNAVQLYLSSFVSASGSRLSLTRAVNSSATTFGLSSNDSIADVFDGVAVQWEHAVTQRQSQPSPWRALQRSFKFRIRKRDKDIILNSYLDYIIGKASDIRRNNQERLIYPNSRSNESRGRPWEAVPFKHPSTFDTLAMDPEGKRDIMEEKKKVNVDVHACVHISPFSRTLRNPSGKWPLFSRAILMLLSITMALASGFIQEASAAGECARMPIRSAINKLSPCFVAARDPEAKVDSACCARVGVLVRAGPHCLLAVLLSPGAKELRIVPKAGLSIPKRCHMKEAASVPATKGKGAGRGWRSKGRKRLRRGPVGLFSP